MLYSEHEDTCAVFPKLLGKLAICRSVCSHSGGYEEYYLVEYNAA
jgi:hypothetical protein